MKFKMNHLHYYNAQLSACVGKCAEQNIYSIDMRIHYSLVKILSILCA